MNKVFTQRAEDGTVVIIPGNLVEAMLRNPAYMKQYVAQVRMAEQAQAATRTYTPEDLKRQHQPVRLLPTFHVMQAQQQQGSLMTLKPAEAEAIRQRQYKAQCDMLAENLAAAARAPALAA
jgi:hypothetical protein